MATFGTAVDNAIDDAVNPKDAKQVQAQAKAARVLAKWLGEDPTKVVGVFRQPTLGAR